MSQTNTNEKKGGVMNLAHNETELTKVSEIAIPDLFNRRLKTGNDMLDKIFGGEGLLPSTVFTLAAGAGLGKTTFLLQMLNSMTKVGIKTAYVSGEESREMLAYTCRRLGLKDVNLAIQTDVDKVCELMEQVDVLVVDSFQCLNTDKKMNSREKESYCLHQLINTSKRTECVLGIVLHVTKSNNYRGSTLIPHAVDANFMMRSCVTDEDVRVIYSTKNRYGKLYNVELRLGHNGFDLDNAIRVNDGSAPAPIDPRKVRWQEDLKKILSLSEPITQSDVTNAMDGNNQRGYLLIKQLIREGKMMKDGRGEEAVYRLTDAGKKSLESKDKECAQAEGEDGEDEQGEPARYEAEQFELPLNGAEENVG